STSTPTTRISPLSLHDALPICRGHQVTLATSHPEVIDALDPDPVRWRCIPYRTFDELDALMAEEIGAKPNAVVHCAAVADYIPTDRKSTRLNSSHVSISYAVFC